MWELLCWLILGGWACISLCAASWVGLWVLMELMTITLVGAIHSADKLVAETLLKYFILQTLGGLLFLVGVLLSASYWPVVVTGLLLKLGVFPLSTWVIPLVSMLPWSGLWLVSTALKVPGLVAMDSTGLEATSVVFVLTVAQGSFMGIYFYSLKKILSASGLVNTGWLCLLAAGGGAWEGFLCMYGGLLGCLVISVGEFSGVDGVMAGELGPLEAWFLFLSLCSLAGVPPLSGFYLKWLVLTSVISALGMASVLLVVIMCVSVYFYLAAGLPPLLSQSMTTNRSVMPKTLTLALLQLQGWMILVF